MNYEALDQIIKERGTTRRKLAIKAGINPATLQSAFQNNSQTGIINTYDIVKRFADILGVKMSAILSPDQIDVIRYPVDPNTEEIQSENTEESKPAYTREEADSLSALGDKYWSTDGLIRLISAYIKSDRFQQREAVETLGKTLMRSREFDEGFMRHKYGEQEDK